MISPSDAQYLEAVEKTPFDPIGWLYESIYADLAARCLVHRMHAGYLISKPGIEALREFRGEKNDE